MGTDNGFEPQPVSTYKIAQAYLDSLHTTTWPNVSWSIRRGWGRDQAAAWIVKLTDEINAIRNMAMDSSRTLEQIALDYRNMVEGIKHRADD